MTEQEYFRRRRERTAHHRPTRRRPSLLFAVCTAGIVLLLAVVFFVSRGLVADKNEPPWVIAVDPGHGGKDLGAVGLIGEVELNYAVAESLCALLDADPDFIPVLTHTGEGGTPKERARTAARKKADLFLSIHGNSDGTGEARGFECYPELPGHGQHEESLRFAKLICKEMEPLCARMRGEGGIRYAYFDEADTKYFVEAYAAEGIEEPSFGVLEYTKCPAVLAEQCFVTNAEDVVFFASEEGIQAAADAYYRAIKAYFGR